MVRLLERFVGKNVTFVHIRGFARSAALVEFGQISGIADGRKPRDSGLIPDEGFIQIFVRKYEVIDGYLNPVFIHWGCELLVAERGFQIYEPHTKTLIAFELLPGVSAAAE
jgi:hypothetical protein